MTGWDVAWPAIIFLTKAISFLMKEFENMSQSVSSLVKRLGQRAGGVPVLARRSDR